MPLSNKTVCSRVGMPETSYDEGNLQWIEIRYPWKTQATDGAHL